VRVAEINRLVAERMGSTSTPWLPRQFGVSQLNSWPVSDLVRLHRLGSASTTSFARSSTGITPWGLDRGRDPVDRVLDLLKQQNLGRCWRSPTGDHQRPEGLLPGGGEFPIPVPQSGVGGAATITMEYKKFGVQLDFTPGAERSKIAVKVHHRQRVDILGEPSLTGLVVPGLRTREMDTHVEVKDGRPSPSPGCCRTLPEHHLQVSGAGDIPSWGPVPLHRISEEPDGAGPGDPHLVKPMAPGASGCLRISGSIPRRRRLLLGWTRAGRSRRRRPGPHPHRRCRCRRNLGASP
jgi:Flp pilus assembly secretin CpaC